jgi:uncharacterized protein
MLKRSYYNIPIKQKGFTIIYNSFSDHFLGVSQEVANRLGSGIFDPENFRIAFPKTFAKLQDLGMLIDDGIDELDLIKKRYEAAKFRDKRLYLMLYPTQDCNLKCWYCYESHKQGTKMSEAVIESVLNYVNKVLSDDKYEAIHVGFFGGEPLMNFSSIAYPLAKGIKKICESKAKAFSTFFVTNASLMTESIIEKMKELNPYFQITIDGYREKHDNVRVWKNSGKGTYEQIIKAIHVLSQRLPNHDVSDDPLITLRINYDNSTLKNLDSLIEDIEDLDKTKVRIHLERVWQTRALVDVEQRTLLINAFKKLFNKGFTITHGVFKRKSISCPSDSNSFLIINYDGTIHKCNGRTLDEDTQEGIINQAGEIRWTNEREEKRLKLVTFNNSNCLRCKMLPVCMGPCSQKYLEEGGFSDSICCMHSIDIPINTYLGYEFEMRYLLENQE